MNYPDTPYNYMKSLRGCESPNPKRTKFNNDNTYKIIPKSPKNINCKFQKHFEVPFLPKIKQKLCKINKFCNISIKIKKQVK